MIEVEPPLSGAGELHNQQVLLDKREGAAQPLMMIEEDEKSPSFYQTSKVVWCGQLLVACKLLSGLSLLIGPRTNPTTCTTVLAIVPSSCSCTADTLPLLASHIKDVDIFASRFLVI